MSFTSKNRVSNYQIPIEGQKAVETLAASLSAGVSALSKVIGGNREYKLFPVLKVASDGMVVLNVDYLYNVYSQLIRLGSALSL